MYDYAGKRKRRKRPNRKIKIAIYLILLLGIVYFATTTTFHRSTTIQNTPTPTTTPVAFDANELLLTILSSNSKSPDELKQLIQSYVGDSWKNYSIYVEDLRTNFKMGINETVIFEAASVNKLPILAATYVLAEKTPELLQRSITPQANDIQSYGTGIIQNDPPGTSYSVKTLARLLMQKSDNTAAYVLSRHIIGTTVLDELTASWDMSQTDLSNNKTSNTDMSKLLKKIYRGQLVNEALTKEMLSFLKDSDFEERIPAKLPEGAVVYHKIGNGEARYHDVGIVETPLHTYYIGIFTENAPDRDLVFEQMATVSQIVYDFLTK